MFLALYCHFRFLVSLFVLSGYVPSFALNTVSLVVLEHLGILLAAVICTAVSNYFTNFASPSHISPAYSSFGGIAVIRIHLLILVSRRESVRIAPILPTYGLPFPITFAVCASQASQEQSFDISTPRYACWSTIGNSSSPRFQLKNYRVHLIFVAYNYYPPLPAVAYSIACSVRFCSPSGVSDIPTKSSAETNPDTVPSPTVAPCSSASTAAIRSSIYISNRLGDNVRPCVR